jgi:hypothetical protein
MERSETGAEGDDMESLGPGDGGYGVDYEFEEADKGSLGFVGANKVKELKRDVRKAWEGKGQGHFALTPTARQTGVLWAYGVQVKLVDKEKGSMFFFICCAHDACVKMKDGKLSAETVQIPLGKEEKSHVAGTKHLRSLLARSISSPTRARMMLTGTCLQRVSVLACMRRKTMRCTRAVSMRCCARSHVLGMSLQLKSHVHLGATPRSTTTPKTCSPIPPWRRPLLISCY